jgi:hypothetical protein
MQLTKHDLLKHHILPLDNVMGAFRECFSSRAYLLNVKEQVEEVSINYIGYMQFLTASYVKIPDLLV